MLKTYEILLDLEKELYSHTDILFRVSRNDLDSVELEFNILQDEEALDLTGTTVELAIKKPSGLTVYQECEIINALEGKASCILTSQSYIESGIHQAEVNIRTATQLAVVNSTFYYTSEDAILSDETEESINDWSALLEALFAYDLKPILTEGFPTVVPEYVGQMAFDNVNNIVYIANDLLSTAWQAIEGGGGGGGSDTILGTNAPTSIPVRIGQLYINTAAKAAYISTGATAADWEQIDAAGLTAIEWDDILNRPSVFTPESHSHDFEDITGKPVVYPAEDHDHTIADITGLTAALDAKAAINHDHDANYAPITHNHDADYAPIVHGHIIADTTGLQAALDAKADEGAAPIAHTHSIADITNLQSTLNAKADDADLAAKANAIDVYTKAEVYNKGEIDQMTMGEGGGSPIIVEDNLTSTSTTNALSANQGRILKGQVDGKATIDHNHDADYATITHVHAIADVTNLQTTLDGKADDAHTHAIADTTGLQTALDGKAAINHNHDAAYAAINHTHTIANVTGLQTALDGKAALDHNHDADYAAINHNHNAAYAAINHNHDADYSPINHDHDADYAPIVHTHSIENITGLQTALDGKADDSDLDGKANTVHTHAIADVTNLQTTLDGKQPKPISVTAVPTTTPTHSGQMAVDATNKNTYIAEGTASGDWKRLIDAADLATKANLTHTHAITDVTNLQTTLDGKADDAHTHAIADVTNLQTTLDGKADDAHNHTIADITNLQTTLDGKADDADVTAKQDKASTGTAAPTTTPSYVGQMNIDTTNKRYYIAEGTASSADWKRLAGTAYADAGDNAILNTTLAGKKLWTGTQATYNGLTKDANTLYFITG
jgi:hypothetical protein